MNARMMVVAALFLLAVVPAGACSGSSSACKDAEEHYCSRLPGFGCQDSRMTEAVSNVIRECGRQKAHDFFQRAIGRCELQGTAMTCPTD